MIAYANENPISARIKSVHIDRPYIPESGEKLLPAMCREGQWTYGGQGEATVEFSSSLSDQVKEHTFALGTIPIMVGSSHCWTSEMSNKELVEAKEDDNEVGGYFIVGGIERIIRMLVYSHPNVPTVITRASWVNKGKSFTHFGCLVRCYRDDFSAQNFTLHYLSTGQIQARFIQERKEYFLPVVVLLKALTGWSDKEIYQRVVSNETDNLNLVSSAEMLLRTQSGVGSGLKLPSREHALAYFGSRFRISFHDPALSDADIGKRIIDRYILVHLDRDEDKAYFVVHMIRMLFAVVNGDMPPDNGDSPMFYSALTSGHLFGLVFREHLTNWLGLSAGIANLNVRKGKRNADKGVFDSDFLLDAFSAKSEDVGRRMKYFLATGNHTSKVGIDLMQTTGFTIVSDRLNFIRFFSHFQSIHRGSFYTEMKTTAIRKLLPEAWGFLCPVHTPDGTPCGLLNHIAAETRVVATNVGSEQLGAVQTVLSNLGVLPVVGVPAAHALPVVLNGRVVGFVESNERAAAVERALRRFKVLQIPVEYARGKRAPVPQYMEIVHISGANGNGFPALVLSTEASRFVRPVRNCDTGAVEFIGIYEQVYLDVLCAESGPGKTDLPGYTHVELTPTNMLNTISNLTPFSDMNQSPRNMYQCQMSKHAMGTPAHNLMFRADNKLLRLTYPQTPLLATTYQKPYGFDAYPTGANAIVAVLSYTGYDMEDALILNKASVERGFMHASMFKTYPIDLTDKKSGFEHIHRAPNGTTIDDDGLPLPGVRINPDDVLYETITDEKKVHQKVIKTEGGVVDQVRVIGEGGEQEIRHATIKLRYNRNPVIGDKFASRHGQKGVLSQLWPQTEMPFTESGMVPDIVFNPHGMPSRMTIGMLVEFMAGKSAALHGQTYDATPFRFDEQNTVVDYFGEQLRRAGFNYYGNEVLYSGITGKPFHADIFFGLVHYQRLVHQVKDKFQVRSEGPVNQLTHQPVHGRKLGGGIRFGEMERDSLIAHGTAMLLHDRLQLCSDRSVHYACKRCGSLVSVSPRGKALFCAQCGDKGEPVQVAIPYVLRFLSSELAAMNIHLKLQIK